MNTENRKVPTSEQLAESLRSESDKRLKDVFQVRLQSSDETIILFNTEKRVITFLGEELPDEYVTVCSCATNGPSYRPHI